MAILSRLSKHRLDEAEDVEDKVRTRIVITAVPLCHTFSPFGEREIIEKIVNHAQTSTMRVYQSLLIVIPVGMM